GDSTLTSIPENTTYPFVIGNTVASFIGSSITDSDAGALQGIAIVGSSGDGVWEYSLNDSNGWRGFVPSQNFARLLRSTDMVRFVPNPDFIGTATITYYAWDQTQGIAGGSWDVSVFRGGSTAFSTAQETATLTVLPFDALLTAIPEGTGDQA